MVSAKKFFKTQGNPFSPYMMKSYFGYMFYGSALFGGIYNFNAYRKDADEVNRLLTDEQRVLQKRLAEPARTPWPVLHHNATQIREGKRPFDEIAKIWTEVQYYYPGDWLIPLEFAQVIKYNNGNYLKQFLDEPEAFRKEIMVQLLNVKYGKVQSLDMITDEIREILTQTVDDLSKISLADTKTVPLTPTH